MIAEYFCKLYIYLAKSSNDLCLTIIMIRNYNFISIEINPVYILHIEMKGGYFVASNQAKRQLHFLYGIFDCLHTHHKIITITST